MKLIHLYKLIHCQYLEWEYDFGPKEDSIPQYQFSHLTENMNNNIKYRLTHDKISIESLVRIPKHFLHTLVIFITNRAGPAIAEWHRSNFRTDSELKVDDAPTLYGRLIPLSPPLRPLTLEATTVVGEAKRSQSTSAD